MKLVNWGKREDIEMTKQKKMKKKIRRAEWKTERDHKGEDEDDFGKWRDR